MTARHGGYSAEAVAAGSKDSCAGNRSPRITTVVVLAEIVPVKVHVVQMLGRTVDSMVRQLEKHQTLDLYGLLADLVMSGNLATAMLDL